MFNRGRCNYLQMLNPPNTFVSFIHFFNLFILSERADVDSLCFYRGHVCLCGGGTVLCACSKKKKEMFSVLCCSNTFKQMKRNTRDLRVVCVALCLAVSPAPVCSGVVIGRGRARRGSSLQIWGAGAPVTHQGHATPRLWKRTDAKLLF